jgi:hypothetical protein
MAGYNHSYGDYLRAAVAHGYVVRACEEAYHEDQTVAPDEFPEPPPTAGPPEIWDLHPWAPEATNAAKNGRTAVVGWDFELRPDI